jgi:hypothetical protein
LWSGFVAGWLGVSSAFAGWVPEYSENFDRFDENSFSGTDGWLSGYDRDSWSTRDSSGVYARTDDDGGTWGSGDALDNHLVQTERAWSDFQLVVDTYQDDNDSIGVVFRFVDARNFYLFVLFGSPSWGNVAAAPGSGDGDPDLLTSFAGSILYRVRDGRAEILDNSFLSYQRAAWRKVRVTVEGSTIAAQYDADGDNVFESTEAWLEAEDTSFPEGSVGFYCYDNGGSDRACRFDNLVVSGLDADGDGQSPGLGDCADDDPTRFLGATETCDEMDDDCDGMIDDSAIDARTWYTDTDGDEFGVSGSTASACAEPPGYALNAGDCDDSNSAIRPGATEVADDGVDQDCDGSDSVTPDTDGGDSGDSDSSDTEDSDDSDTMSDSGGADSDLGDSDGLDSDGSTAAEDRRWNGSDAVGEPGEGCRCTTGYRGFVSPSGIVGVGAVLLLRRRRR